MTFENFMVHLKKILLVILYLLRTHIAFLFKMGNCVLIFIHSSFYKFLNYFSPTEVEFYLVDSFEIFHFLPIYWKYNDMNIKSYFICEPCLFNTSKKWFDYESSLTILKNEKVRYRKGLNENAHFVFTTQDSYLLSKYKSGKKICLSYGLALNFDYFNLSKRTAEGFDYRLVHGQFMKEIQSKYIDHTKIKIIGYPKHFQENLPSREVLFKELEIKTEKRILVYFPTWDEDCSVIKFADSLRALKKDFYFVTKLHHCIDRLESLKPVKKLIYEISDLVLPGNFNFAHASILADYAIIDAKSGASTEVCYINNKVKVILLTNRNNIANNFYPEVYKLGPITNKPEELNDLVYSYREEFIITRNDVLKQFLGDKNYDYLAEILPTLV